MINKKGWENYEDWDYGCWWDCGCVGGDYE